MARIELEHVGKDFGTVEVLHDISLDIEDSEFMAVVGPSGCGKSTLIRMLAGFERPSTGAIRFDGTLVNDIPPGQRGVAMVFQNYALYPHMTGRDNIAFGLRNLRTPEAEVQKRVRTVAEILQIEPLLDRLPDELSGGQRQRIAIGRAIIRNPKVFLFDEPLSNLDAALRGHMRVELARLHRRFRVSTVYVTHDQIEAMTLADRIAVLNKGRLEQVGPPLALYHRPKNLFVAGFLGSPPMNLLPATVLDVTAGYADMRLHAGGQLRSRVDARALRAHASVTIGIRPQHMRFTDKKDGLAGRVNAVERLGSRTVVYVTLGPQSAGAIDCIIEEEAQSLRYGHASEAPPAPDTVVHVTAPPESVHLFDEQGLALPMLEPAEPVTVP
ncbi:MAG: ABC transporter ATP-binding protein [Nitrospiraceae bacterium]|nr:ABC transporter ATP-binding protein [Nitrospiraceae bacterium]